MADFARGERLRGLRKDRHLSQETAAHEIGVSVKTIRSWEKGGKIQWRNAKRAGTFYEVDPESLVSREVADNEETEEFSDADQRQLDRIEGKLDDLLDRLPAPADRDALETVQAAGDEAEATADEAAEQPAPGQRRSAGSAT